MSDDVKPVFDGVTLDGDKTGKVIPLRVGEQVSFTSYWDAGTSVATLAYEMTNDPRAADPATADSAAWHDVTAEADPLLDDASVAAGVAGKQGVVWRSVMRWLRMRATVGTPGTTVLSTYAHVRRITGA